MVAKKFTKEQLKRAREIVDQEEAIEFERRRRETTRRKKSAAMTGKLTGPEHSVALKPKRPTSKSGLSSGSADNLYPTKLLVRYIAFELLAFWLINGFFRLYASAGEGSLYRTTLIWAIPLLIIAANLSWYVLVRTARTRFPSKSETTASKDPKWKKEFDDWNHGRTDMRPSWVPPSRLERLQVIERADGSGDYFAVREKKEST